MSVLAVEIANDTTTWAILGSLAVAALGYFGTRKGRVETTAALVASAVSMSQERSAGEQLAWRRNQELEAENMALKLDLAGVQARLEEAKVVIETLRGQISQLERDINDLLGR